MHNCYSKESVQSLRGADGGAGTSSRGRRRLGYGEAGPGPLGSGPLLSRSGLPGLASCVLYTGVCFVTRGAGKGPEPRLPWEQGTGQPKTGSGGYLDCCLMPGSQQYS